jgi:S1-C subfamily serine protease
MAACAAGPAARSGLKKGDALLEVNEEDVTNLNHHQVASMLMECMFSS